MANNELFKTPATGIFVVKLPKCLSKLISSAYVQHSFAY